MLPLSRQNAYRARYAALRPGWRTSGDAFEALTRQHLSPTARVLDVGCGRGGVMELFWREVSWAVGLDPDLASLRERRAPFPATQGFGSALPFPAESFDVVIALWVLEHLSQPERVLAEARRVLAPSGHFLFLTPNAHHPLILANRLNWAFPAIQRVLIPRLYGRAEADTFRVHYRANTPSRLRALAAASGFHCAELRAIKDPTYLAFNEPLFHLSLWLEEMLPLAWGVHLLGDWVAR